MKRYWLKPLILLVGAGLYLAGCQMKFIYKEQEGFDAGWKAKKLSPGVYEVAFALGNGDSWDAQYGCLYRAAEIAYEHGYQFYEITQVTDHSQNYRVTGSNQFTVHHGTVYLHIRLSQTMTSPQKKIDLGLQKWMDAYYFLNRNHVPWSLEKYTIEQRKADARKGIHTWYERQRSLHGDDIGTDNPHTD